MATSRLTMPSDESLESIDGWQNVKGNAYAAVQAHIVVFQRRARTALRGSPVKVIDLPAGAEYTVRNKTARVAKLAGEIQQTIQETVTSKFSEEIATKIASEVNIAAPLLTGKMSGELQSKVATELTEAIQGTLAHKRSFEIQDSEELTRSVSVKSGQKRSTPLQLQFYLNLWPCFWDFYLYRVRYLRLRYQQNWIWPDVRDTIAKGEQVLKLPMFRVKFFEPQDEYSLTSSHYDPEVTAEEAEEIKIESFTDAMRATNFPVEQSLESLARIAFPASRQERRQARARRERARKVPGVRPLMGKGRRKVAGKGLKRAMRKKSVAKRASKKAVRASVHQRKGKHLAARRTTKWKGRRAAKR